MSALQTDIGGPKQLSFTEAFHDGAGAPVIVHGGTWQKGDTLQIMRADLNGTSGGPVANSFSNADGGFGHGGEIIDAVDGVVVVVTSRDATLDKGEGRAMAEGGMYVSLLFEDAGGGNSNAITEGQTIYLVDGAKHVTVNSGLTDVGRKCGVVLETLLAGARTAGAASNVRCLFKGLPAHLD